MLPHSHKKRKGSLETQAVLLIFSLELEISGVAVQSILDVCFCEELPIENNFEGALATFCCYDQGVNASEAVQKTKKSIANAPRVL